MTPDKADKILEQIALLAESLESDDELFDIDPRYRITAKWIDTNIENADVT